MTRTKKQRRPTPRPGAAKLGVELDKKIGENAPELSQKLITDFLEGSPTAQNIIARWAEDAQFAQQCVRVHGKTLTQLLQEIEAEQAEADAKAAAESSNLLLGPGEPELLAPETPLPTTLRLAHQTDPKQLPSSS